MIPFVQISSDYSNLHQSWTYSAVWRNAAVLCRVEIRANAYEEQSHATISTWSTTNGWVFHTSLPTSEWYPFAPSYVLKREAWEGRPDVDAGIFHAIEFVLLDRLATALFGHERVAEGINYTTVDGVSSTDGIAV